MELQKIDLEIDTLRRSQEEFPGEIAGLQEKMGSAKKALEDRRDRITQMETNRRLMEGELEAINADLKKHQDRLYEVKSNREYDALQLEIETLRGRADENETSILEGIEQTDALKAGLEEEETAHKGQRKVGLSKVRELQGQLDSVEEEVRAWTEKRTVLEAKIERRALSIYNRIRKLLRGGLAVVQVEKGSCGGCFRLFPPQRRVEIRRQDQIIRCENCGRIVAWKDEEEA